MPQTPSTRWCPTPEQLMILEEMYRSGVRTPNAAEIQQITAHLAYYGRIEGKNVFYWFQNHKARERQRLRRRLCARHQQPSSPAAPPPPPPHTGAAGGGGNAAGAGAGVNAIHPAVMQLHHHHHTYATSCFMAPQGYLQQETAAGGALPVSGLEFAGKTSQQQEWMTQQQMVMENSNINNSVAAAGGSSAAAGGGMNNMTPPPWPCCRPLRTLELFPTKSTGGGLRDECSSSKSSSCSTSTN
ncbi:WUSCHEL-related homeobox 3-like isoform X1 [Triticum dicoccoides]|uniref:Homeobox domain-containing protein n=1 Tax=Triticum turgidum subsp. durum TaxID=4567 RepID=A0A9R0TN73_TRITD|nr:WUSCHEL-related homeobox 3-like isoform X1 [Triticum dicoccoides]VAI16386.1 unnamed protein product [Triticum turgidum subsp. durum]